MRFCPHCGAPLMAGAKFCIECGRQLADAAEPSGRKSSHTRDSGGGSFLTGFQLTNAFIAVFFGITIVGLAAAAYILLRAPISPESASTAPGASTSQSGPSTKQGSLPPGHPKIQLPTEARTLIDQLQKQAEASPKDVAAWVKLGAVSMRAALFDSSYYDRAELAYAHVLKLNPDNLDALRGIGDIDYDRNKYDQAIAAYEHFLKQKPDDPEVRTDLGTMYLYTGNADQAVAQYKKAVALKPDLYQAYYNLGVAYGELGNKSDAAVALTKAISLAPDSETRQQVIRAFTKITGKAPATNVVSSLKSDSSKGGSSSAAAPADSKTFRSAFEEMVRNLPVAGSKVTAVQWPSQYRAKVLMANFPMNAMPPFARDKFLDDLKTGIDSAKKAHKVTAKVEVDIVDSANGQVMQSVTE